MRIVRAPLGTLLIICTFFQASAAFADSLCNYYKKEIPYMYKVMCTEGGSTSKPAGANSTFSDSFNVSAAALPTEPSSYGLEVIGSYLRSDIKEFTPTFSLIKGFHKFGAGISTSGSNTFFGNDIVQRATGTPLYKSFAPHEPAITSIPNLNLGTSFELNTPPLGSSMPKFDLGISGRHNQTTDTWGGGPALMVIFNRFTIGGGFTREKISTHLQMVTFTSLLVSTRISIFEFEYTQLRNAGGYALGPVQILSGTISVGKLLFTLAERQAQFLLYQNIVLQPHLALQYQYSKHLSIGAMYNYIPGASSLAMQYFL